MAFGLSTHLVHGEQLTRDHLARIAAHGFDLVELFATRTHIDYHDAGAIRAVAGWLRETGLTAWSIHAPITDGCLNGNWGRTFSNASKRAAVRDEAVRETLAAVEMARHVGARVLVLHLGIPEGQEIPADDNDAGAVRQTLEPIAAACDDAGVQLAIEVIPNALATADAVLNWLRSDLELGRTGACLDVGHAHLTGGAPEAADLLSGDIVTTHIHDNRGRADEHLVPFEGTVDWPATLFGLVKAGYEGPLMFELPDHGDVDRTLSRAVAARQRLRTILDDLAAPFPFEQ
jgi:sugar phosphate isomerase/epimerase